MTGSTERPPVRIVHLGLGAFHRAHQVWFTQRSDPDWGIAAFAGRSARLAEILTAQDCVYTLIERGPMRETHHRMTSLVQAFPGSAVTEFQDLVASPSTAVVTVTITEIGYEGPAPGRLLTALAARRDADAGPIAVVPCDNLRSNGTRLRQVLFGLADPDLKEWLADKVSFVDTVSDRITPATVSDDASVVTEPFAEWVLAGEFPAGRPTWAGAQFVEDIRPYERRKLRLLNGAHLLLALIGLRHGHQTVAEAIADPELRSLTEEYWDVASLDVPGADAYRQQLLERFANARIRHSLRQIATDVEAKLRERIIPLVDDLEAADIDPAPALRVVTAARSFHR